MLNRYYIQGDQNVNLPVHLNFGKYILDRLRLAKDQVALECVDTGEALCYKELTQYVVSLSAALSTLGVRCGDVVALGSERRIACIPTALAVICTGATCTPYELHVGRGALIRNIKMTSPNYLICSKLFWETYEDVLRDFETTIKMVITLDDSPSSLTTVKSLISNSVDVDTFEPAPVQGQTDTAFITYSSGTTGLPKAVQLTHLNCIINCCPTGKKDEYLQTAFINTDWSLNYATFITFRILYRGAKLVFFTDLEIEGKVKYLAESQVNVAFVNPFTLNWLLNIDDNEARNLDSIEIVFCTAASLHAKLIDSYKRRFPKVEVLQGYAMTEVGAVTSEACCTQTSKSGSVGIATPGVIIKVVDPDTRELLGPNKNGEICVKGPGVMKGYIGVPRETYLDEQGFYKTGDLGHYDSDGYFFIVDRFKEIFKYKSHMIAPQELETLLLLHPAVLEAAVVGKQVPLLGHEPAAFVVLKPGATVTEQELIDYVAAEVAPLMQLRGGVRFTSELPRNSNGKVLRCKLKTILAESQ